MTRRPFSSFPLLPSGVRDHLPLASVRLRAVQAQVRETFVRWGYAGLITPLYEYLEVLERGLGHDRRRETFKFVEPRTGEIVALRPDITPQVARVFATRFAEQPGIVRLSYDGRVVRFAGQGEGGHASADEGPQPTAQADMLGGARRGRARTEPREVFQAGAELLGAAGAAADAEVIALLCAALDAAGVAHFQVDLGHGEIAWATLQEALPQPAAQRLAAACLGRKDEASLRQLCDELSVPEPHRAALLGLCGWYGPLSVLDEAAAVLVAPAARAALVTLEDVATRLCDEGLGARLSLDLGELREQGYHDGVCFHAYAAPVPEAIASGGRYDHLTERFGRAAPATGFAIDLEALLLAQEHGGGAITQDAPRVLVQLDEPVARIVAEALRRVGVSAVRSLPGDETPEARSTYDVRLEHNQGRVRVLRDERVADEFAVESIEGDGGAALVALVAGVLSGS